MKEARMSLTGGFDVCIEIGDRVLTDRAVSSLATTLGALNSELDIRVREAVGDRQLRANLHLFVTSLRARAVQAADARVDFTLTFREGAVRVDAPFAGSVSGLAGTLTFSGVPVTLGTDPDPATADDPPVTVDFTPGQATAAALQFQSGADRLRRLFEDGGLDADAAQDALEQALLDQAAGLGIVQTTTALRRAAPGRDGNLTGLRFVALDLTTRRTPAAGGVLCLLGTVSVARVGRGALEAKDRTALTPGYTTAVAIDAQAMHDLYFCPAALQALLPDWLVHTLPGDFLRNLPENAFDRFSEGTRERIRRRIEEGELRGAWDTIVGNRPSGGILRRLGDVVSAALPAAVRDTLADRASAALRILPPTCGLGEVHLSGARLVSLDMRLVPGRLRLAGRAFSTHALVDGDVVFRNDLRLVVRDVERDGETVQELDVVSADLEITPQFTPSYLAVELIPVTLGLSLLPLAAAPGRARDLVRSSLSQALQSFMAPDLPDELGVLTEATVDPEAVVLSFVADARAAAFPRAVLPSLTLGLQERREVGKLGRTQTQHFDTECLRGDYTFQERDVTVTWTVTALPTQLDAPIRYTWTVGNGELPPGEGVLDSEDGTFRLRYDVSPDGSVVTLSNEPGARPFRLTVSCRAVDVDGLRAETPPALLHFDGSERVWGGSYTKDLKACLKAAVDDLEHATATAPSPVAGIGPVTLRRLAAAIQRRLDGGTIDPLPLRSAVALSDRVRKTLGPALEGSVPPVAFVARRR
jgi:hypothetical protein